MSSARLARRALCSPRTLALIFVLAGLGWTLAPRLSGPRDAIPPSPRGLGAPQADPSALARAGEAYGNLPLSFEANAGQADSRVKFLSRGSGYGLFLTQNEAVIALRPGRAGGASAVLRMSLAGANAEPRLTATGELPGKSNYFIGKDPAKWRTNVAHFSRVRYEAVYKGIDLEYYGNQRQLEYDFRVAPGADPDRIRLAFGGAQGIRVDEATGDLVLETKGGELRQHKPF